MRGGHGASGPPPDPNALRRDRRDDTGWTTLPAAGREGEAPAWPLSRATKRELELWAREWRRPQAVEWERNGQEMELALYVRAVRVAEKPTAPAAARNLVVRQQETLGISVPGLHRLRWRIAAAPAPAAADAGAPARARFKVVTGGAG